MNEWNILLKRSLWGYGGWISAPPETEGILDQ
jgi:hypothetical protein